MPLEWCKVEQLMRWVLCLTEFARNRALHEQEWMLTIRLLARITFQIFCDCVGSHESSRDICQSFILLKLHRNIATSVQFSQFPAEKAEIPR